MRFSSSTAVLVAALPLALAQTFSKCDPTKSTKCDPNPGLKASSFKTDWTQGANSGWSPLEGTYLNYGSKGAEFTIKVQGNAPTIESNFYILFGRVDVVFQAAPSGGVISSIVLESDDLDEIDWEFVGGDTENAQTNYYGKGNTTTYDRAKYIPTSAVTTTFHTYSIDWTAERLQYIIDGNVVRTLNYADAVGGKNYPQTPMRIKLGNWTPPSSAPGTVTWAGGPVDFSKGPFTMYVKSVSVQNYNPASSYVYGDMSGSWQSIQINGKGVDAGSSSSSFVSSAVGTGKATSVPDTATKAPTSSLSVIPISQTAVPTQTVVLRNGTSTTLARTSTTIPTTGAASSMMAAGAQAALLGLAAGVMLF